jgi:hypothetical protein
MSATEGRRIVAAALELELVALVVVFRPGVRQVRDRD